jgi:hypothetical protein
MISVESCRNPLEPVERPPFSTARTHRGNGPAARKRAVFPVVHTPYDFYERI